MAVVLTRSVPDDAQPDIDRLVAAFVRIRGIDRLEGAIMTRIWLAADMGVEPGDLDRLLRLMRWQGLIDLPNEHLITIKDADAMRDVALGHPAPIGSPINMLKQAYDRDGQRRSQA